MVADRRGHRSTPVQRLGEDRHPNLLLAMARRIARSKDGLGARPDSASQAMQDPFCVENEISAAIASYCEWNRSASGRTSWLSLYKRLLAQASLTVPLRCSCQVQSRYSQIIWYRAARRSFTSVMISVDLLVENLVERVVFPLSPVSRRSGRGPLARVATPRPPDRCGGGRARPHRPSPPLFTPGKDGAAAIRSRRASAPFS